MCRPVAFADRKCAGKNSGPKTTDNADKSSVVRTHGITGNYDRSCTPVCFSGGKSEKKNHRPAGLVKRRMISRSNEKQLLLRDTFNPKRIKTRKIWRSTPPLRGRHARFNRIATSRTPDGRDNGNFALRSSVSYGYVSSVKNYSSPGDIPQRVSCVHVRSDTRRKTFEAQVRTESVVNRRKVLRTLFDGMMKTKRVNVATYPTTLCCRVNYNDGR